MSEQRAASPQQCATIYNIPLRKLRKAIATGACAAPHRLGRHSVLFFSDVESWLRSLPPTRSSRRRINEQRGECHAA